MSTSRFIENTIDGLLYGSPRSFGSHLLHLTQYIKDDDVHRDTIDVSDMPRVQIWETIGENSSIFSRGKPRKSKKEVEAELNAELKEISEAESEIRKTIKECEDDIEDLKDRKIDIKNSTSNNKNKRRRRSALGFHITADRLEIEDQNVKLRKLQARRNGLKRRRVASTSRSIDRSVHNQ